jgi:hypothetical protein
VTCLCGPVGCGYAKLFGGVQRGPQDPCECRALDLVIIVESIHGDIALVRAAAGYGTRAAIRVFRSKVEHPGLEGEQRHWIAAIHRQSLNRGIADGIALGRVGKIQRLRRRTHVDGRIIRLHAHRKVDRRRLVHQQLRDPALRSESC